MLHNLKIHPQLTGHQLLASIEEESETETNKGSSSPTTAGFVDTATSVPLPSQESLHNEVFYLKTEY
jgi:hypothetical protein